MTASPPDSTHATSDAVAHIDPLWWSWEGAHGGHVAAAALSAVRDHAAEAGQHPARTLTTHFLAPVDARPLPLTVTVPSAGRRVSTCTFTGEQDGRPVIVGSAVFGPGRPGPSYEGSTAPAVPGAPDCPSLDLPVGLAPFAKQVEIRPATEGLPLAGGEKAELVAWVRFADDRPLDAEAVVTLTDVLPPGLYAHWRTPRPVPTAELTVHFTDALDDGAPRGWALVRIRTEQAGSGWAVDDSTVWSADGRLLALARQARVVQRATAPVQETS
ncbi:thioesterase family protein [Streptomyces sp. NBC_00243]|uniref:acyl-CoA thioesterase n=1 Tax=Streptomyces sp. NBC_00243 TaxID=2975688 RepID=UPI002DDAFC97|nr:thioesterase family protein [Streptomyces sp. NBC_00243]WRZ24794.1 thioesterase family protein [Streptomyces sp. NBC_00243]